MYFIIRSHSTYGKSVFNASASVYSLLEVSKYLNLSSLSFATSVSLSLLSKFIGTVIAKLSEFFSKVLVVPETLFCFSSIIISCSLVWSCIHNSPKIVSNKFSSSVFSMESSVFSSIIQSSAIAKENVLNKIARMLIKEMIFLISIKLKYKPTYN
ncbi:MAG: hypothetical protein LBC61_05730 [Candidatus Peribacteria bacterium]|nr:hypothetical protein [Candidatus Peribacteria bacterium]